MSYVGFYKRRRGILEHLESGKVSLLDTAVHDLICLRANAVIGNGSSLPPGVWKGSAAAIHALCPRTISERAIQRSLEHLERIGWIKRWLTRGKKGNYPILVCRYSVADLSGKGYVINGEETTDWRQPKLESVTESSSLRSKPVTEAAPYREKRIEKRAESFVFAGKYLRLTGPQLQAFREGFPSLDVEATIRKADAWCVANPERAPRKRHARFVNSWLSRERPAANGNNPASKQPPLLVGDADPRGQLSPEGKKLYEKFSQGAAP